MHTRSFWSETLSNFYDDLGSAVPHRPRPAGSTPREQGYPAMHSYLKIGKLRKIFQRASYHRDYENDLSLCSFSEFGKARKIFSKPQVEGYLWV